MIPGQSLSSLLIAGLWLPPDDLQNDYLRDFELGGIGLNDPSAGLRYQPWTLWYDIQAGDVVIEAPEWPQTVLFTRANITELSLAFDQNMNPFVAFVEDGQAKFWWFDTDISQTVFSNLPANSKSPRCCLDDKRETQTNSSDIILAYVLDNKLYFRAQRDRYQTQYFLKDFEGRETRLQRVGMNEFNRLQFLLVDALESEDC